MANVSTFYHELRARQSRVARVAGRNRTPRADKEMAYLHNKELVLIIVAHVQLVRLGLEGVKELGSLT